MITTRESKLCVPTYALLAIAVGLAGAVPVFAVDGTYCVGNFVWHDLDRDGIQDAGEPGVPGVVVTAWDCDAPVLLAAWETDASGYYTELCWCAGMGNRFYLVFSLPEGYAFTLQDQGLDDTKDSDVDALGMTTCFVWPPDVSWNTCDVDAGLVTPICPPGTGTPGYWMNHPEAWPVDEITIGGITYPKALAIALMKCSVKGDKTYTMFPSLVAAKLNVMVGNESSCIGDIIKQADVWMALHPIGTGVAAKSDAWQQGGEYLHTLLDMYNNGKLCAPSRDEVESLECEDD